jgi:hypothetical protein
MERVVPKWTIDIPHMIESRQILIRLLDVTGQMKPQRLSLASNTSLKLRRQCASNSSMEAIVA